MLRQYDLDQTCNRLKDAIEVKKIIKDKWFCDYHTDLSLNYQELQQWQRLNRYVLWC